MRIVYGCVLMSIVSKENIFSDLVDLIESAKGLQSNTKDSLRGLKNLPVTQASACTCWSSLSFLCDLALPTYPT